MTRQPITKILFYLALFLIINARQTAVGADEELNSDRPFPLDLGIVGGINFINHETKLPVIPGAEDCGVFKNGKANGFYVGLDASYEIFQDWFSVSGRFMYDTRPITLSAQTFDFEVLDPETNEYVPLVIDHTYEGELDYFTFDAGIKLKPLSFLPFVIRLSVDLAYPLFGTDVLNYEEINSPDGFLFPDDVKRRTVEKGSINSAGTSLGASAGLQAEFRLQKGLFIVPEISYRYGLNSALTDHQWNMNVIRAGVGLTWKFGLFKSKEPEKPPEEPPQPPLPEPEPPPVVVEKEPVIIKEAAIVSDISSQPVEILETIVTQTYPLLPYVFFDSTSADLKANYKSSAPTDSFDEDLLPKETLGIYYRLLDIIGFRLKNNEKAKLTITGLTDGNELPDEEARLNLADERARAVTDYLKERWGLDDSRFIIKKQNYPNLPTSEQYSEGFVENRRVELSSNVIDILSPVVHSKFMEYASDKDFLDINLKVSDSAQVRGWNLILSSKDNKILGNMSGEGLPDSVIKFPMIYEFLRKVGKISEAGDSLNLAFTVIKPDGSLENTSAKIGVVKSQNKFELGRLNLIVFDFDRYDISSTNKDMLRRFIESSIQSNSQTWIKGSTDRLGEKDYNMRLSVERAKSVRDYLLEIRPKLPIKDVSGTGDMILQYDNDLPEGRFYCRTVLIEVKTPLK